MNYKDFITDKEIEMMQGLLAIGHHGDGHNVIVDPKAIQADSILQRWFDTHIQWIDLFKGKTQVEIPITYIDVDNDSLRAEFFSVLKEIDPDIKSYFSNNFYWPEILNNRINQRRTFENYAKHWREEDWTKLQKAEHPHESKEFQRGTKLTKVLKSTAYDQEVIDNIILIISQFKSRSVCEGTLVISVHPLDYLTSSINDNGWGSCHGINGSYWAGNLSYLYSPHTAISYIKSDNSMYVKSDIELSDGSIFTWNNKIWRAWFHGNVEKSTFYIDRHYPSDRLYITDKIIELLLTLGVSLSKITPDKDEWETLELEDILTSLVPCTHELADNGRRDEIPYTDVSLAYDDYCRNFMVEKCLLPTDKEHGIIAIGEWAGCILCGRPAKMSNIPLCPECGEYGMCYKCNQYLEDNDLHERNGHYFCAECVEGAQCNECERYVDNTYFLNGVDLHICDRCLCDYYKYCEKCEKYVRVDNYSEEKNMCHACIEEESRPKTEPAFEDLMIGSRGDRRRRIYPSSLSDSYHGWISVPEHFSPISAIDPDFVW